MMVRERGNREIGDNLLWEPVRMLSEPQGIWWPTAGRAEIDDIWGYSQPACKYFLAEQRPY